MKKSLLLIVALYLTTYSVFAQSTENRYQEPAVYYGREASTKFAGAEIFREGRFSRIPSYVKLKSGQEIDQTAFINWFCKQWNTGEGSSFELISVKTDELGITHSRYVQTYQGHRIESATLISHARAGRVFAFNGTAYDQISWGHSHGMSESDALQGVLLPGVKYKWEDPRLEAFIKYESKNPDATFFPKAEMVYASANGSYRKEDYRLCYKFDVYADKPMSRKWIFVDAENGAKVLELDRIHHIDTLGTATTGYLGLQAITTDWTGSVFRLREYTTRGASIQTYNMLTGTNYAAAVDFIDSNNSWNNVNPQQDEYATDAHLGTEFTWDYYWNIHNRNSIDDAGFDLLSYVHYDVSYDNAFWDGTRMTYGDGSSTPFTALDVCGHEVTHGVTENTSGLVYVNESGALNEGFSDIFGAAVEFYALGTSVGDWLMGEDLGIGAIRDMSNPNAFGDPDTYLGTNWYIGTADNGGVHTNSGVINFWFYILSMGDTGVNDLGDAYAIEPITIAKAEQIAYRMNMHYLISSSDYADARFYGIMASNDLYGGCSFESVQTTNAFYAVGVGDPFDTSVVADFSVSPAALCAPGDVNFTNLSVNAATYQWNFGDGVTDTNLNPVHNYSSFGSFDVWLIADGGVCGADTILIENAVNIDDHNPCIYTIDGADISSCYGVLYDDGGPAANHSDNITYDISILPVGATSITLTTNMLDLEPNGTGCYDYLQYYNGPSTASPSLGVYCNSSGAPGPLVTGAAATLRHFSDINVNMAGFEITFGCFIPSHAPFALFDVVSSNDCTGEVEFADRSLHGPTSWFWDFGDGATSTAANPTHTYGYSGYFTVQLIVSNSFGTDSITRTNIVFVNKGDGPLTVDDHRCDSGIVNLSATPNDTGTSLEWYDAYSGGSLIATGTSYSTAIAGTTTYYVQEVYPDELAHGGAADDSVTASTSSNSGNGLIFDCIEPVILNSVKVYASTAGNRTIQLQDNTGLVLESITQNLAVGTHRINLNWNISPASGLRLVCVSGNLIRNSSSPGVFPYPYSVGSYISIVSSTVSTNLYDRYYYFYDWEVVKEGCISERSPVSGYIGSSLSLSPGNSSICSGSSVEITATSPDGSSYLWSTGDTSSSITVSPTTSTLYTITATGLCGTVIDSVRIDVDHSPSISTSDDTTICEGNTVVLNANAIGGGSIIWTPGSIPGSSISVSPSGTNIYTATLNNACGTVSDATFIFVNPLPTVFASADVSICGGDSTVLSCTGNGTPTSYSWDPGLFIGDAYTVYPNSNTSYTVTNTNGCGSVSDIVTVSLPAGPIVSDGARCDSGIVNLSAILSDTANDLNWYDAPNGGSLVNTGETFSPALAATTMYYVEEAASDIVLHGGAPDDSISTGTTQNSGFGLSFDCYESVLLESVKVYATTNGNRTIQLQDSLGNVLETLTLNINSGTSRVNLNWTLPVNNKLRLVCSSGSLIRNASSPGIFPYPYLIGSYVSILSSTVATNLYDRYYYFYDWIVRDEACNSGRTAVTAFIGSSASISASDVDICSGDAVTLTAVAAAGTDFSWSTADTTASISVNPSSTTTYVLTADGSCGISTDSITINVAPAPALSVSADTTICEGDSVRLTASGNLDYYLWNPGGFLGTTYTVAPGSSTTYTINGVNACGALSTTVNVNVNPLPTITASADQSICLGSSATLSASGNGSASSWTWTPGGATGASISVSPLSSTNYTVTNSNSCGTASDDVMVNVDLAAPTLSAVSNDTNICAGESVLLSASGSGEFTWSPGSLHLSSVLVSPTTNTSYTVSLSNSCGDDLDTVNVSVTPLPTVTASGDEVMCSGSSVSLSCSGSGGSGFEWNPGAHSGSTYNVSPSSTTTYVVSNGNSCGNAYDSVLVEVIPLPNILSVSSDTTICEGQTVKLSASGDGTWTWLPGSEHTADILVAPTSTTTYTVSLANVCGTDNASMTITVNPLPIASFSSSTSGYDVNFSNSSSFASSSTWDFGDGSPLSSDTDPMHSYSDTGTYIVSLTVSNECGESTISEEVVITKGSGIHPDRLNEIIAITPNPNQGLFEIGIETRNGRSENFRITNAIGQLIWEQSLQVPAGKYRIAVDGSKWASGIYSLHSSQGEIKFVIER